MALSGQPVKRGTMAHKHIVYMMLADAAAQLGDTAALPGYATQLEELAVRDDHQPYLAIAHRAWGVAHRLQGEYSTADERLRQALAIFAEREAHWQTGRTRVEMAELALAQGDETGAGEHFSQAVAAFEQVHAEPDIQRVRARLAALA